VNKESLDGRADHLRPGTGVDGAVDRRDLPPLGKSERTFYRWKKKFGTSGVAEVRRLKQLEDESTTLKRLVADLGLDKAIL
jgi:hypothetical protein